MDSKPKIAFIQFPGSNTENETVAALERNNMVAVPHFWNDPPSQLRACDGHIVLGGFSYEDRSRSGIIASLDPIIEEIKKEVVLGKPVLGICNGAQILVESGIVPGNENFGTVVGLTQNKRVQNGQIVGTGYFNAWCHIKPNEKSRSAFIEKNGGVLSVPLAHAEGRFVVGKELSGAIKENSLASYHYCTRDGNVASDFPTNPNGSVDSIAALSNLSGNAMAIMPHPERTINGEGDAVFRAMNKYVVEEKKYSYKALRHAAKKIVLSSFEKPSTTKEVVISMIIADNEASSVEKCAQKIGADTTIKKYLHFEIETNKKLSLEEIYKTDVLFNPSKEFVVRLGKANETKRFLVREKENIEGRRIKEILQKRFGFGGVKNVQKGIVWEIGSKKNQLKKDVDLIINSHILSNPISQVCHEY